MRGTLRRLHRWLALGCALLWLSQAVTGLLMVYRWELDDALLAAPAVPFDPAAVGQRIADIEHGLVPRKVTSLWASGGVDGRFDLYVDGPGERTDVLRIDGAGRVLRERPDGRDFARIGLVPFAASVHQTLFAGDTGHLVIGLSGLVLIVTLVMGAVLALPRGVRARAVLWPGRLRAGVARRFGWHRALGVWFALPALVLVSAGVMLVFYDPIERGLGQDAPPAALKSVPAIAGPPVSFAQAVAAAMQEFPGAALSGVSFPSADQPWYRIRVRQGGEWRRVYGTTTVYVAAADARVLAAADALASPPARRFLDNLYPVHTGEAGGTAGRLLAFAVGTWLLGMLVLGVGLWWARRA